MIKNKLSFIVLIVILLLVLTPVVSAFPAGTTVAKVYYVKQGDTLWLISQKFGVSVDELMELNDLDGYTIYIGQKLYVQKVVTYPEQDQNDEGQNDPQNNSGESGEWFVYTVKKGDTLWAISRKYGVSLSRLIEANNIKNSYDLYVGRRLIIPVKGDFSGPQSELPQKNYMVYEIKEGDRIWNIAYRYGTTVYEIMRLNGLDDVNNLQPGERILLQLDNLSRFSTYAEKVNRVYRVLPGDTLEKIGQFFGIEPRFIRMINGLDENAVLYPGKKLLMPVNAKLFGQHEYYLVRQNREYLFDIAFYYGVSVKALIKANYYADLNKSVPEGTIVLVPLDQSSRALWKTYNGENDSYLLN